MFFKHKRRPQCPCIALRPGLNSWMFKIYLFSNPILTRFLRIKITILLVFCFLCLLALWRWLVPTGVTQIIFVSCCIRLALLAFVLLPVLEAKFEVASGVGICRTSLHIAFIIHLFDFEDTNFPLAALFSFFSQHSLGASQVITLICMHAKCCVQFIVFDGKVADSVSRHSMKSQGQLMQVRCVFVKFWFLYGRQIFHSSSWRSRDSQGAVLLVWE